MKRLQASSYRNEELEASWRRPEAPQPVYSDLKYLVSFQLCHLNLCRCCLVLRMLQYIVFSVIILWYLII